MGYVLNSLEAVVECLNSLNKNSKKYSDVDQPLRMSFKLKNVTFEKDQSYSEIVSIFKKNNKNAANLFVFVL